MLKIHYLSAIIFVIIFDLNGIVDGFNLSPIPNLILKMPNVTTEKPKLRSSYFGYTIVLREKSVIIAAPRAQSILPSHAKFNETGEIFKCELNFNESANASFDPDICYRFPNGNSKFDYEFENYQWLGASMDGGPKDSDTLLICAPRFKGGNNDDNYFFHGICYWTIENGDEINGNVINKMESLADPEKQTTNKYHKGYYLFGEQGFSAHITPNNRQFLMGAPGFCLWKGSVIGYDIATNRTNIPDILINRHSYLGYAVSSGYLDSENPDKIINVATSPHTSSELKIAKAILFEFNDEGNTIETRAVLEGSSYGEYFGYAVIVEDVNSDGIDDVIVSAPLRSLDGTVDVGAVYVFLNSRKFSFTSKLIASPFKTHARFGTTLSKLGDINRDGYADIAIGAPFVNGHGAVAIYLGGPNGLHHSPSQIIGMESPMHAAMFGHGLSKGVDIDQNGFNDLAIGAPETETVYIYRSYPVVSIKADINAQKQRLHLTDTELEVEFCFQIETGSTKLASLEILLEIELDPQIKRINNTSFKLKMSATKDRECQSFVSVVRYMPQFVFTPIELVLRYDLVHDAHKYRNKEFCSKCALLEPTSRRMSLSTVAYEHGCKGSICEVDLKIAASKIPANFTLGSSNIIYVEYFVENVGENAFDTNIEITTSLNVSHAKILSNCAEDKGNGNKLICNLSSRLAFTGNATIEIAFDMSSASRAPHLNITAAVSSGGHEIQAKDNVLNSTIELITLSAFDIIGLSNETFVSILEKSQNLNISYKFSLQNNGPSTLYDIDLWLIVPLAYVDSTTNSTTSFLNANVSHATALINEFNHPVIGFESINSTSIIVGRTKKSIIQQKINAIKQILPRNNTLTLNAKNSQNSSASALLRHHMLEVGPLIEINIILNIEINSVKRLLKNHFNYLELFMDLEIESNSMESVKFNITKILSPIVLVNITSTSTPIFFYVSATVGGLILIALITLALRKIGFFKRQTKEDMEKIINEKLEKARMKAEIASEIPEENE